jgi:hypothetical protein
MRPVLVLIAAMLPLGAQMASRAVPAGTPSAAPAGQTAKAAKIPIRTLYLIERSCDEKLTGIGEPRTVDLLGTTRGVYLDGYGAVFTTEMNLVTPPAIYPFHQTISKEEAAQQHEKKLQRLPALRNAMKEVMRAAAASLAAMPDNQQVVLAVRLDNMQWENTTGIPGMILMKADRKSALAGQFQIEEE